MKKRFLISLMAAVLLLPAGIIATAAPAADSGSAANGICRAGNACAYAQNCSSGANQNNYVDDKIPNGGGRAAGGCPLCPAPGSAVEHSGHHLHEQGGK